MKSHKQKKATDDSKDRDTQETTAKDAGAATGSEQTEATHPRHKKSPVTGNAHFESRPYGRHTARMVGHEPGTENL